MFGYRSLGRRTSAFRGGDISLKSVVASAVFDLDATESTSYPGSGTSWLNLVPSPADGAAQTAYNFPFVGTPVFTGTAGDNGAYWALSTGNYFQLAANTDFLRDIGKTSGGSDFWLALAFNSVDGVWAAGSAFNTGNAIGSAATGISLHANSTEALILAQNTGGTSNTYTTGASSFSSGDYLAILSHSHSGNATRSWVNSTTKAEATHTFGLETSDPNGPATIGADTDGSTPFASDNWLLYGVSAGNAYIDDAQAAAIFAHLEARHGRNYTP